MRKIGIWLLVASVVLGLLSFVVGAQLRRSYFVNVEEPEGHSRARVLVLLGRGLGEEELVMRMKIAARNIGIQLSVASSRPPSLYKPLLGNCVDEAVRRSQPDFIFSLQTEVPPVSGIPNYLWLSNGWAHLFKELDEKPSTADKLQRFDGFLCAYEDIEILRNRFDLLGIRKPIRTWFPGTFQTSFAPSGPIKLFYCGANWDSRRAGSNYKDMFCRLDEAGLLRVYGLREKWRHTPASYGGRLPSDGTSLLAAMQGCGIALMLHSQYHLESGAISSRIFEASAASCVSISDPHPFIKKYFGENVLYIEPEQTGEELFSQVDRHVKWIQEHPDQARDMASRCHQIASGIFSMEEQLNALIDFHNASRKIASSASCTLSDD